MRKKLRFEEAHPVLHFLTSLLGLHGLIYNRNKGTYERSCFKYAVIVTFCFVYSYAGLNAIRNITSDLNYSMVLYLLVQVACSSYLLYVSVDVAVFWKFKASYLNETAGHYTRLDRILSTLMRKFSWCLYFTAVMFCYLAPWMVFNWDTISTCLYITTHNHIIPSIIEYEYRCLMQPLARCRLTYKRSLLAGETLDYTEAKYYSHFVADVEKRHRMTLMFNKVSQ